MQTLYAFFQSENDNLSNGEKELLKGIDKISEMFVTLINVAQEVISFLDTEQENAKTKHLPTDEERNPNKRLSQNFVYQHFLTNREYLQKVKQYQIHWKDSQDLIRKIYSQFRESDDYNGYLISEVNDKEVNDAEDKKLYLTLITHYIAESDVFISLLEEENVYWHDDFELVYIGLARFIKALPSDANEFSPLPALYKDPEDDKSFMIALFRKTILNHEEYDKIIESYIKNWEMERIAMMDVLLMKMALAEVINFPGIPIKVSLNEYIEISKNYSTPRSSVFINGNLDKIIADLKRQGKIEKTGRGLVE